LPTNFGEIAHYNKRIATRFYLLAQIERNSGKNCEAEYHAQLALRYLQAAEEQWIAMRQEPGRLVEVKKKPRPWALLPEHRSLASTLWSAFQRLAGRLGASARQSNSGRESPIQTLSLN
jgi:hypothetical protein